MKRGNEVLTHSSFKGKTLKNPYCLKLEVSMNCICKQNDQILMYRDKHICDLDSKTLLKAAIMGIKDSITWRKRAFKKEKELMNLVFKNNG